MDPQEGLRQQIRHSLGVIPGQDGPQTEPDYETRIKKLGAALYNRGWTGPETLYGLALTILDMHPTAENLGTAQLLMVSAGNLHNILGEAETFGRPMAAAMPKVEG